MDLTLSLLSTGIWEPFSQWAFFILIIISIWIVDLFLHHYYDHFKIKSRIKEFGRYLEQTKDAEKIASLITNEFHQNSTHYVANSIISGSIKKYLSREEQCFYSLKKMDYVGNLQNKLRHRSYKLLSMCIVSAFIFFVFFAIVYFRLPEEIEIFHISSVKNIIYIALYDPFILFLITITNCLFAAWTFLGQKKLLMKISIKIVEFDSLINLKIFGENVNDT